MDILYLVHRIPYPPDKGDKIRSFRWLVHLAKEHRVHLVTLCDDPNDLQHADSLREYCATVKVFQLRRGKAKIKALAALAGSKPLSLPYFFHADAKKAVQEICAAQPIDLALVYSSSMCQYVDDLDGIPTILDMVDVDSAKFARYAELGRGFSSRIYGIEARRLGRYEEKQVQDCDKVILVTEPEADLLRCRVSDSESVVAIGNGTNPPSQADIPAKREGADIVFVGAMDYQPNVDAVIFGAKEVLPGVRAKVPDAKFIIVGRDPTPEVKKLAALDGVEVTGAVKSIDDYLIGACMSLVPLRIAQGIQNKVLEAMAWSLPVVTNRRIAASLNSDVEGVLCSAETADEYVSETLRLLGDPALREKIGTSARDFVIEHFSWGPRLAQLDALIEEVTKKDKVAP